MAILFLTLTVIARNLLRGNRRRNTFRISFCLAWGSNPGFMSNKPTHYLLDHGDFKIAVFCIYVASHGNRRGLADSKLAYYTNSQSSNPRPDIKTKAFLRRFLLSRFLAYTGYYQHSRFIQGIKCNALHH